MLYSRLSCSRMRPHRAGNATMDDRFAREAPSRMKRLGTGRMMDMARGRVALLALLLVGASPGVGAAFDAGESFAKGTTIFSLQMGGGAENKIETPISGITFLNVGPRLS